MTQHDTYVTLRQMIDHCHRAIAVAGQHDAQELSSSLLHSLALPRALELIGEAATRVPNEFREAHPVVPWRDIIDFRNVLIHAYDVVDFEIAVRVVRENLPPLVEQLRAIVEEEQPE